MEKFKPKVWGGAFHPLIMKIERIMKLTTILCLIGIYQAIAVSTYSQTTRLSLSMDNARLKEVLATIEENSEFYFLYSSKLVDVEKNVSVNAENKKIEEILSGIFKDSGVEYVVMDRQIILSPRSMMPETMEMVQQQRVVSGKVIDETGQPLPGVTVMVKGTTQGTVTNADGNYSLAGMPQNAVLIFSFVGMKTQEVEVGGQTTIGVIMEIDAIGIEEVVAIGYGTQKKINLTGSVEAVKGSELIKRPVMSTALALQGLASGVTVSSNSGQPGRENESIRIRGIGTLNNNDPLVLIDGVVSSINAVSPYDIESISILKDAASASIYGSRAASGVILITTKRAKSNQFSVSLSGNLGLQQNVDIPKYLGSVDFMEMYDLALSNDTRNDKGEPGGVVYGKAHIDNFKANMDSDPFNYPNTNWAEVSYKTPSFQQMYNLTLTGGTDKLKALVSLNFQDQTGIISDTYLNRYSLRSNVEYKFSDKFSAGIDVTGRYLLISEPYNATFGMGEIRRTPPMNAYSTPEGRPIVLTIGSENPWVITQEKYMGYNRDWSQEGLINLRAAYSPFQSLRFDLSFAPKINFNTNKGFENMADYFDLNENFVIARPQRRTIRMNKSYTFNGDIKFLTYYDKVIEKHHISALGGFQQITNYYEYVYAYREQGQFKYDQINSFPLLNQAGNGSANEWALQSYFGRINYIFDDKYLFEANVRYDGSSRFAQGYQWGMFPSFSAGWRFSQEAFMENVKWINNAKLRASWGQLGNQLGVGNYDFAMNINLNQQIVLNQYVLDGYAATNFATKNLSWETTNMTDIGIDLAFIENKLELVFDYYIKMTNDILMPMDIPSVMGYSNSPNQNAGKVENKGWDLNVIYNDSKGDFNWRVVGTLSDVKNEIIDMKGIVRNFNVNTNREGFPINSLWGLQADGLFPSWQAAQEHPVKQYGRIQGGDIKYIDQPTVDTDGDGEFDSGDGVINNNDFVVMGNTIPRYTYSLDLYAQYKSFDIGLYFQGVGKRDGYLRHDLAWAFNNNGNVQQWQKEGMWQEGQTNARYPRMFISSQNNIQSSTFWVQNASYLRLKNLQFGYTFPQKILKTTFVKDARLFISCQNLFTIKHMTEGNDPEQNDYDARNSMPLIKTYSFGFNLNF